MNISFILMALASGIIIFISIVFHELGHFLYWRGNINKHVKFKSFNGGRGDP